MNSFFVAVALSLVLMMSLVLFRAIVGPTIIDRLIAVNVIGTKTLIILILIGFLFNSLDMFIDLALTYALLNFIASVAAAKLIKVKMKANIWNMHD
ncbi:MAG: hypothetical protein KDD62_14040 [Bdellovibrionales bacterium]|nr:hypothetical protein [Bdellovibrionales bacterium]